MKVALCLLVKNEKKCLDVLLPLLIEKKNYFDKIIVIDGNSTDGSREMLMAHQIDVYDQKQRGRGAAIIEALDIIKTDAVVLFSPDGNEDINDLPNFRTHLEDGADLVIASRMMQNGRNEEDEKVFKFRKWANLAFNKAANILFSKNKSHITDSINGYRAITKALAEKLKLDALDYTIEYQMTIRALKINAKIIEFPTHEGQRIAGKTGASSIPTGILFLKRLIIEIIK